MECGWDGAEAISACFKIAKPWIALLSDLSIVIVIPITYLIIRMMHERQVSLLQELHRSQNLQKSNEELAEIYKKAKSEAERRARRLKNDIDEIGSKARAAGEGLADENKALSADISNLRSKIADAIGHSSESENSYWSKDLPEEFALNDARTKPIIMLGNQKGGVGKTTISGNLAAALAARGMNVLAIDLDYQGSMSAMLHRVRTEEHISTSRVEFLMDEDLHPEWYKEAIFKASDKLHYIPCHYTFEAKERNIEMAWALGERGFDARFFLYRALRRTAHIQEEYDIIVIDTPPRMTTGFVNAFACATHLFIPTLLDKVSVDAVRNFSNRISILAPAINPGLKIGGVIASSSTASTQNQTVLPTTLYEIADQANRVVREKNSGISPDNVVLRDAIVPYSHSLAAAASGGVAYLQGGLATRVFDNLAAKVLARIQGE